MPYFKKVRTEQDFVNQYLKEIRDYPQLEKKEERELLFEYRDQQTPRALNLLITSNLRFVVSVAIRYQNQGLSMPELINEGNLGLMEGIRRFNPSNYSVKFISYAVWWIRQSIIKALYEKSRLVRVSAEKESKIKRINLMAEESLQKFGVIDHGYVAKKTESKDHEVRQILSLSNNRVSMDCHVDEKSECNLHDLIEDTHTTKPDEFLNGEALERSVADMIDTLSLQEQKVVRLYFGVGHQTTFNLEQIGKKLNISKERVRQIKKRALEKMKSEYQSAPLADVA